MKDNSTDYSSIIKTAHSSFQVSKEGEERIFRRIAELTEKKREKVNPFLFFTYVPSLSVIVLLVFLLPLIIFTSYTFLIPRTISAYPLVLVSESGVQGKEGSLVTSGYRLNQGDRIVAGENTVCDITLKKIASLRFSPGSEAELTTYSEFSNQVTIALTKGSLYINKDEKKKSNKELIVRVESYRFMMAGTRVFFEIKENTLAAICFEGILGIYTEDGTDKNPMISLFSGEKIELSRNKGPRQFIVDTLSSKEKRIDEKNKTFPKYEQNPEDQEPEFQDPEDQEESGLPEEKEEFIPREDKKEEKGVTTPAPEYKEPEKLMFTRSSVFAHLTESADQSDAINFYASCHDNESAFIVTRNKLFRIRHGKVEEPVRFPGSVSFKVRPLLYKSTLILPEARNLFLINKDTGEIIKTIPFKEKEFLEDNYYPLIRGPLLYIPVRNTGYYALDVENPGKGLSLIYTEDFPLTPVVISPDKGKETLIIGAFYENYIAALDSGTQVLWKMNLPGDSFCNMIKIDNNIYTYIFEDDAHKIIEISSAGTRMREWKIKNRLSSDILPYQRSIIGIYTEGTLFSINLDTNEVRDLVKVVNRSLSTRSWRNYYPLLSEGFLFTGTENGRLIIYNPEQHSIEKELIIDANESFYTSPFRLLNALYLISNSGTLYQVL